MNRSGLIVIGLTALLGGCITPSDLTSKTPTTQQLTECPETRPQMCTMDYNPVCGLREDDTVGDYANGCTACADDNVTGWAPGKCP
jgi:hypothetical protein